MVDYAERGWEVALIRADRMGTLMGLLDALENGESPERVLRRYHRALDQWKAQDAPVTDRANKLMAEHSQP